MLPRVLVLAAVALLPLSCVDRAPSRPAADLSASTVAEREASPARPSPRSVAPRASGDGGLTGTWGGNHLNLTIGEAGGLLAYDCAHGSIDQPFTVDSEGRFDLVGTHVPETPGPVRKGQQLATHPARYTGTTDGKTMTLNVTLTDSGESVGPFTLTRGVAGRVFKCL